MSSIKNIEEQMRDETLPELLEVGIITSPQGLKGELRVYPDSDFPERFTQPGTRWIQDPQTAAINQVQLISGRYLAGKNLYVIKLEGVEDRNQAETLRNYKMFVAQSDRPKLEPDEYHVRDLMGLEVYLQETGEHIGVVVDLYTAGNDLLEIKLNQQPATNSPVTKDLSQISRRSRRKKYKPKSPKPITILVPFVKEIVPVVDLDKRRIELTPPAGLINIHETGDR